MARLDGQVALVTGAGTGIGRASAIALAQEGASLVLVGRRQSPLDETAAVIRDAGGTALALSADVTDPDSGRAVVAQTESELGRLDILVNNAGGGSKSRSVRTIETEDFEAVQRLNVTARWCSRRRPCQECWLAARAPSSPSRHLPPSRPAPWPASPTALPRRPSRV